MRKWETGNESGAARPGATGDTKGRVEGCGEIREERGAERVSRRQGLLSGATHGGYEEVDGLEVIENSNSEKGAACPWYERYGGVRQGERRRGGEVCGER